MERSDLAAGVSYARIGLGAAAFAAAAGSAATASALCAWLARELGEPQR